MRKNDGTVSSIPTPGCRWVLAGEGEATEMVDGARCAVINGRIYRLLNVKPRKNARMRIGAIPCQPEPDPETGVWPHWIPVNPKNPEDKWVAAAWLNTVWVDKDGEYEAVGPHFRGNPYGLDEDFLEPRGRIKIHDCPRDYEGIKEYLCTHQIEGIVFWRDGEPVCKIKRRDFGFDWPVNWEDDTDA